MSSDLDRIKRRWRDSKQISTLDVEWLLSEAKAAEIMRAANTLHNRGRGTFDDLLDGIFGGKK